MENDADINPTLKRLHELDKKFPPYDLWWD
jgi:hypothetical protein